MSPVRLSPMILCLTLLGGCASFPEVDAATRKVSGPAPMLNPVDEILAQADALGQGEAASGSMQARAAALRAKAARLRRM